MLITKQSQLPDQQWHIGEPLPFFRDRVVTFQADGDELDLLLTAMDSMSLDGQHGHYVMHRNPKVRRVGEPRPERVDMPDTNFIL